jgi:hypothetical protein
MGLKRSFNILAIMPLLFAVCKSQVEYRNDWPIIANLDTTISINALSEIIFHKIPLKDQSGKVTYALFCHGGNQEYLDKLSDSTGSNFVGALCFLLAIGENEDVDASLLCEDGSAPWFSRGQINDYTQLIGDCGKYPEYGRLRHFRLRGFILTLHFINIIVGNKGSPIKFDVHIRVHRDKNITSSIAEQTGYLTPYKKGRSCNKILKGNEPRMFRGENGSWYEEKDLLKKKNR